MTTAGSCFAGLAGKSDGCLPTDGLMESDTRS